MNIQKLLGLLQGCHSILGLCWPKPGVSQMADSRIFIGTKPFVALEDGIRQTDVELASLCELAGFQTTCHAWRLVVEIVARFRTLGPNCQSVAIDPAYNLIYLTTGVLYHHMAGEFSVVPEPVQPYATVENLEKLLADCAWKKSATGTETGAILESLIQSLQDSLARLNNESVARNIRSTNQT